MDNKKKAFIIHISICLFIGGIIAFFTNAKWFAASFWVSAGLYINGSLAYYEDALPGGFENPDGKETPEYAKGFGAFKFWFCSIAMAIVLALIGLIIQKYAWWSW